MGRDFAVQLSEIENMRIVHIYIFVCVGENVTHNTHRLDDRKELCPLDNSPMEARTCTNREKRGILSAVASVPDCGRMRHNP